MAHESGVTVGKVAGAAVGACLLGLAAFYLVGSLAFSAVAFLASIAIPVALGAVVLVPVLAVAAVGAVVGGAIWTCYKAVKAIAALGQKKERSYNQRHQIEQPSAYGKPYKFRPLTIIFNEAPKTDEPVAKKLPKQPRKKSTGPRP